MDKVKSIVIFLIILICFAPCCSINPGKSYIEANYRNAQLAIPDLINYIEQDERLEKIDKEVRTESLREWMKLIEDKYKELEK